MSWRAFLGALRPVILFFYARQRSLNSAKVRFRQIDVHCSKDRCWPTPAESLAISFGRERPAAARRPSDEPTFNGEAADIERDRLTTASAQSEPRPGLPESWANVAPHCDCRLDANRVLLRSIIGVSAATIAPWLGR
jgi:hypothetical protein